MKKVIIPIIMVAVVIGTTIFALIKRRVKS